MKRRIFITIACMMALLAVAVGFYTVTQVRTDCTETARKQMQEAALSLVLTADEQEDIVPVANALAEAHGARVSLMDEQGTITHDSAGQYVDGQLDQQEMQQAEQNGIGYARRFSQTTQEDTLFAAARLPQGQGYVRIGLPMAYVNAQAWALYSKILLVLGICVVSLLLLMLRFSEIIVYPITEMTEIAREHATGMFDRRMPTSHRGELGQLASALNDMSGRLEQSNDILRHENAMLEAIMEAMNSGVLAMTEQGEIISTNSTARQILGIEGIANGQDVLEATGSPNLHEYLQRAATEICIEPEDLIINVGKANEKIIRIYTSRMKEAGEEAGVVAVFEDISDLRRLQNIRTEFAANVSHELKTPLTSIRGFVETLKQGVDDVEQQQRFLEIIDKETERLTRIINDILYLSELESHGEEVGERVDILQCVEQAIELLEPEAEKKHLHIALDDRSEGVAMTMGNRDRVMQMLLNLLSNAIKYTPEGSIAVSIECDTDNVYISVSDTGIGIPVSAQERLFERFYRVDKGRSREMGGTGLGLAIVKHVVLSMDGDVRVQSTPGEGSVFTAVLPRN